MILFVTLHCINDLEVGMWRCSPGEWACKSCSYMSHTNTQQDEPLCASSVLIKTQQWKDLALKIWSDSSGLKQHFKPSGSEVTVNQRCNISTNVHSGTQNIYHSLYQRTVIIHSHYRLHVIRYIGRKTIGFDGNYERCKWRRVAEDTWIHPFSYYIQSFLCCRALHLCEWCIVWSISFDNCDGDDNELILHTRTYTTEQTQNSYVCASAFPPPPPLHACPVLVLSCAVLSCIVLLEHPECLCQRGSTHCFNPLSHTNNCVPDWCPMHFSYGSLNVQWVKSFPLPPPTRPLTAMLYRSPACTLCLCLMLIPPHAHFQPLSLKSMGLILLGLMDFSAKVRRMHFNHGRS